MIKPAGPDCNMACEYCYYLDKAQYYPGAMHRMDEATLEQVTIAYLSSHPGPEVQFAWQGGEPLLAGLEFFERAMELQARHSRPDIRVTNALQTNAILIDDHWAEFRPETLFSWVSASMDRRSCTTNIGATKVVD